MKALEIEGIDDFTAERLELGDIKAEQVLEITTRETTYVLGIIRVKGNNVAVVVLKTPQNELLTEGERVSLMLVDRDGSDTSQGQRLMFFTKEGMFKFNSSKVKGFVMREPNEKESTTPFVEYTRPVMAMEAPRPRTDGFTIGLMTILGIAATVGIVFYAMWQMG